MSVADGNLVEIVQAIEREFREVEERLSLLGTTLAEIVNIHLNPPLLPGKFVSGIEMKSSTFPESYNIMFMAPNGEFRTNEDIPLTVDTLAYLIISIEKKEEN